MKTIKKKIFNKATFLFLALMLMMTPLTVGAIALDNASEEDEIEIIGSCCFTCVQRDVFTMTEMLSDMNLSTYKNT